MGSSFQDHYHLTDIPEIPCDYECPRCGGKIIHKMTDMRKVPMFQGDEMHWYICEADTCNCSWVEGVVTDWNNLSPEERQKIRQLRETLKETYKWSMTDKEHTLEEVLAELKKLGAEPTI